MICVCVLVEQEGEEGDRKEIGRRRRDLIKRGK
jgi:hypothetical protein